MRICSVSFNGKKHGLYIYSTFLNRLLSKKGRKIQITPFYFVKDNTIFSSEKTKIFSRQQLIHYLRNHYDVIHIQYDTESLYSQLKPFSALYRNTLFCLFIRSINVPMVITVHGIFDNTKKYKFLTPIGFFLFFYTLLLNRQIHFILHSKNFTNKLKNTFPRHQHKFFYIFHPIYTDLIKEHPIVNLNRQKKLLITLGFIGPWKGQRELINIIQQVRQKVTNFRYLIIGYSWDSQYLKDCFSLINKYKLENHITLKNTFISAKLFSQLLHNADIYLDFHTRKDQISSGTLIHVLAANKTAITTSTPFSLNAEFSKKLITVETEQEYIHQLVKLINNRQNKKATKKNNIERMNKQISSQHYNLYCSLL